jgi:hypothetical protein
MLDVDLDGFYSAEVSGERDGRTQLTLRYVDGTRASFWSGAKVAQRVVDAVHALPS